MDIAPTKVGDEQEVEFLLYKQSKDEPYRTLHMWIDVAEAPQKPCWISTGCQFQIVKRY